MDATITNSFKKIEYKHNKIRKYYYGVISLIFIVGIVLSLSVTPLLSLSPIVCISVWIVTGILFIALLLTLEKMESAVGYTTNNYLFYRTYVAMKNIKNFQVKDDRKFLSRSIKNLGYIPFSLNEKIRYTKALSGIRNLSQFRELVDVSIKLKKEIIPRLKEGKDIENIMSMLESLALFFHNDSDMTILSNILRQIENLSKYEVLMPQKLSLLNRVYAWYMEKLSVRIVISIPSSIVIMAIPCSIGHYLLQTPWSALGVPFVGGVVALSVTIISVPRFLTKIER